MHGIFSFGSSNLYFTLKIHTTVKRPDLHVLESFQHDPQKEGNDGGQIDQVHLLADKFALSTEKDSFARVMYK